MFTEEELKGDLVLCLIRIEEKGGLKRIERRPRSPWRRKASAEGNREATSMPVEEEKESGRESRSGLDARGARK